MDFDLNSDQELLSQTVDRWVADHMTIPPDLQAAAYLPGEKLAEELAEQGYMEIAQQPELGVLSAVLMTEAIGHTPFAIEVARSAIVAPMLGLSDLPRPLAILDKNNAPTRFLSPTGAALVDAGDHVRLLMGDDRVKTVANPYPFPFARFDGDLMQASKRLDNVRVEDLRLYRALATCAEGLGAMDGALKLTIDYVRQRVQFGRPIGSFQSVQHKLAECTALVHGARWLIYRAAVEGVKHIDEAADFTHDAMSRVALDTTQFNGATGQTMEYPLHLWVYRLRILQFELHGTLANMRKTSWMANA